MKWRFMVKLVMPGLVPGIHVLAFEQERRGWPGRGPAMTENESFSSCQGDLKCKASPPTRWCVGRSGGLRRAVSASFSRRYFRISRRRAEQRLLQFVDAFRKPRPFAGE